MRMSRNNPSLFHSLFLIHLCRHPVPLAVICPFLKDPFFVDHYDMVGTLGSPQKPHHLQNHLRTSFRGFTLKHFVFYLLGAIRFI